MALHQFRKLDVRFIMSVYSCIYNVRQNNLAAAKLEAGTDEGKQIGSRWGKIFQSPLKYAHTISTTYRTLHSFSSKSTGRYTVQKKTHSVREGENITALIPFAVPYIWIELTYNSVK